MNSFVSSGDIGTLPTRTTPYLCIYIVNIAILLGSVEVNILTLLGNKFGSQIERTFLILKLVHRVNDHIYFASCREDAIKSRKLLNDLMMAIGYILGEEKM